MGYYRDVFKLEINLGERLPAAADAAPVALQLSEIIVEGPSAKAGVVDELETCPRRKRSSTGRKSKGGGLGFEWPSDDSLTASSTFHASQGH